MAGMVVLVGTVVMVVLVAMVVLVGTVVMVVLVVVMVVLVVMAGMVVLVGTVVSVVAMAVLVVVVAFLEAVGFREEDSSLELYGYCVKPASAVAADLLFDAKGAVDEALGSNPSLLQVLGGLVDVELSTSLAACPVVEGVADSVEIDTKCLPVECSHGYILEKSECRRPAEEEGEGMRSGILAGLVFGCIAGTTVLLGAIYIIARRRRSAFYDIGPGH
eukprot:gene12010-18551_t